MKKFCRGIALAMSALVFSAAQADVVLQDCNDCSTAQVESLAPMCGQGYAYVSDLVSQNLYKVCFTWDVDDGQRPPKRYKDYTWAQPESNVQQTWQAYRDVYLNNGHREEADVSVNVAITPVTNLHADNGKMNAYDTVGATQNNNAVINYLNTTYFTQGTVNGINGPVSPGLAAAFSSLLNHLQVNTPLLTINPNFPLSIVVVFNDGSKRTYSFSFSSQQYQAVSGTATDAHGNLIPENTDMASNGGSTNTYDYTRSGPGYDQPNLENLLNQFGAKIVNQGGGFVTCSWRSDTHTLTCEIHPY